MGNLKAKASSSPDAAAGAGGGEAPQSRKSSSKAAGAYLVYSTESGGVLTLVWSDDAVPNALAFFYPRKAVPAHKKTQNAGRLELMRGIASGKVKMLEGVVHFVKEAATFDGDVKQLDNAYFDMWYCQGTSVKQFRVGEFVAVSKVGALAVLPHQNASFKGVQKYDVNQFINTAIREGAAWKH
jgi:hypothetical protein